ncbi:MAG: Trk system potassium transporter TrkA [Johnsonella sp.]|nr:Trk system potassium transporter TrkA [Johnsonella sp.]
MRIIIIGGGKVGRTIAEQLNMEGHDIAVIDSNIAVVESIVHNFDVLGVVGNGASYSVLTEAGIEEAEILIAVTDSDELNLLCCMIAKKRSNCSTIARVRNPTYNSEIGFIREELGLAMVINPEYAAATEIARILRFPSAIKIDTFARGKVELLEFEIDENSYLCDKSLIEVSSTMKSDVLVCAVERGDEVIIPKGRFVLKAKDKISIVASPANFKKFFSKLGMDTHQVSDAMLVGGGKIAYYLAQQLINMGIEVKIIEKNQPRCEELSSLLPKAIIINGDGTDKDTLLEEDIDHCSAFVSLTGIDEANIFLSLFAKSRSNAKIITKVNRISFDDIVENFNLGSIIYPKFITAEYIVRYVRALQNGIGSNVETLYRIVNKKAEALEFKIQPGSPVIGIPLQALNIKDNILVACINRKGKIIIPNGQSVIAVGDTVVVIAVDKGLDDIKDILKA